MELKLKGFYNSYYLKFLEKLEVIVSIGQALHSIVKVN